MLFLRFLLVKIPLRASFTEHLFEELLESSNQRWSLFPHSTSLAVFHCLVIWALTLPTLFKPRGCRNHVPHRIRHIVDDSMTLD